MIYIFEITGTNFIKLGFTRNINVYYRIQYGFFTNKHPIELCNKLSPENLKLLFVYEGDTKIENDIKNKFKSVCGEFYNKTDLNILTDELDKITEKGHIFDRPSVDFFCTDFEKLPCCGGDEYVCNLCEPPKYFPRLIKYQTHKKENHGKKIRIVCDCDMTFTVKRNLDRHKAKSCKLNPNTN